MNEKHKSIADVYISIPITEGFVLRRNEVGVIETNVPHYVVHHSPNGYEWGYGGSGPADLALNIMESVLRRENYRGPLSGELWDGNRCFAAAYNMHQDFKFEVIGRVEREIGGVLNYANVREWVNNKLSEIGDEPAIST